MYLKETWKLEQKNTNAEYVNPIFKNQVILILIDKIIILYI